MMLLRPSTCSRAVRGLRYSSSVTAPPPRIPTVNDYRYFLPYMTRWQDNDMYGHLNNVVYIAYVDGVVNEYLINYCELNPQSLKAPVGLVINSSFTYRASLSYPSPLLAALAVSKLGKSSVTYSVALFDAEDSKRTGEYDDIANKGCGTFLSPPVDGRGGEGKWKDARFGLNVMLKERNPAAYGHFVHVFVDPDTRKPVAIPDVAREALSKLIVKV